MNALGENILKVMEESSLGRMSIYVLTKQTRDLGVDLECVMPQDVPRIAERMKAVLPFFLGEETEKVVTGIRRLVDDTSRVRT